MNYLLEIYRDDELVDKKYTYTIGELIKWYEENWGNTGTDYKLWEYKRSGSYFTGV